MDEYAQEEFEQADNALADAKKLRQSGGTDRAVVNRLYYACFHAATAIFHTEDVIRRRIEGLYRLSEKNS